MKISNITITLKCLFCHASLEGPEETEYSSGDLIRCVQCGEENDFDSVLEVAKEEGGEKLKKRFEEQLIKEFKGMFRR